MVNRAVEQFPAKTAIVATDKLYVVDSTGEDYYVLFSLVESTLPFIKKTESAYFVPTLTTSPTTNGLNLLTAISSAASSTPNGLTLSATNRATVLLFPGTYTLSGGALVLANQFVDLIGVGAKESITLTSTGKTVSQTSSDNKIQNLSITSTSASGSDAAYYPNTSLPATYIKDVVFTSTTNNLPTRGAITYSGTYVNCTGSTNLFGGSTTICSGTFTDCTGGQHSFGGNGGTASGTFLRCTATTAGFGNGGTISGLFDQCKIVNGTFTGTYTTAATFINCQDTLGESFKKTKHYNTTTNTTVTVDTLALASGQALHLKVKILGGVGTLSAHSYNASEYVYHNLGAGPVQFIAQGTTASTGATIAATGPVISGNNVLIQFTGETGDAADWIVTYEYTYITPA